MSPQKFADIERVDARDKVLGVTRYAADFVFPKMLYAMLVPATIAKGRVVELNTDAATKVPGVSRVLTAKDFLSPPPFKKDGPPPSPPTIGDEISYRGQPLALVLGESLEAAIQGAEAIQPRYSRQLFVAKMDSESAEKVPGKPTRVGQAEAALAKATVLVDEHYETPTQHHNPIELFATTGRYFGKVRPRARFTARPG